MDIIRLNLIPDTNILPVLHSSQYDKGRKLGVELYDGKKPYILTDETVEVNIRKGDNNIVTADLSVDSGSRMVVIETTEQMTAIAGNNEGEIRILKGDTEIGTLNFILFVEGSPTAGGIQSESEINNLKRQIEQLATPVLEEVAPPIVERIVPEVIGDNYYNKEQTDALLEGKADVGDSYTKSETDVLLGNKADKSDTYTKAQVDSALSGKANVGASYTKSEEDALLANKANSADVYNKQTVDNKLAEKANTSDVNTALATKADKADAYTKAQVDSALLGKANVGVSYTKTEEDNLLSAKANTSDVNTALAGKADKADTYTKTEVDNALGNKADKSTTYTKQETDTLLSGKADKSDTYTKAQVDGKVAGLIDDTTEVTNKVWSSKKTYDEIISILPTGVASGSIANFNTSLALPLKSAKFGIEATQASGTPTPTTPIPIVGYDSVKVGYVDFNQLAKEIREGQGYGTSYSYLGTLTFNNGTVTDTARDAGVDINYSIDVVGGHKYLIGGKLTLSTNATLNLRTVNTTYIVDQIPMTANTEKKYSKIIAPQNATKLQFMCAASVGDTLSLKEFVIIDLTQAFGKEIADYLYSLPDNGLDIVKQIFTKDYYSYNVGGTKVTVDSVNGEHTCPNVVINLGGTYYGGYVIKDSNGTKLVITKFGFNGNDLTVVVKTGTTDNLSTFQINLANNHFSKAIAQTAKSSRFSLSNPSGTSGRMAQNAVDIFCVIDNTLLETDTALGFISWLIENDVVFYYTVATPIEIALTDIGDIVTLVGENNIFADSGNSEVVYRKSIDDAIAELQALILG